jgi:hypothetical protein
MTTTFIAIFDKNGYNRALKTESSKLGAEEYALRINIELPESLFEPRPIPTVTIKPSAEHFTRVIEAEVVHT